MIPPDANFEAVDQLTPISGDIEVPVRYEVWVLIKSGVLESDAYYSGEIDLIDTKAWQTIFRPTGQSDALANDPASFFAQLEGADSVSFFTNRQRFLAAKIEATWEDLYSFFWFFIDYDITQPGEDVTDSGIPFFDPAGERTGLPFFGEPPEPVEPEPPTPDPDPDPGDPVLVAPEYSISYDEDNDRIIVTIAQAVPDAEGYQLSYQINGGLWTADTNVDDSLTHYILNGSQSAQGNPQIWFAGDTVRVGIRAREGVDNYSPWVYHQTVFIPPFVSDPPPPVPTGLALSQPSVFSANINASWNASAGATSYDYRHSVNGGAYSGGVNVGNNLSAAITASNWSFGDSVRVTVRARNSNGASAWSSAVLITPALAVPPPPTALNLSWNESLARVEASFTGVAQATSYHYRWRRNTGAWSSYSNIGLATSFNINSSGWVHNDSISVEVQALNAAGASSTLSSAQTVTITPPAIPTGFSAIGQSTSAVGLTWNAAARATNYRVEFKLASSSTYLLHSSPTGTSATVTGLAANTNYDFRVRAENSGGVSGWATDSGATLSVPPPIYTYTLSPGDSIQAVMNVINPGESVGFNPGTYNGKWSLSRSNSTSNNFRLVAISGRPEFRFFGTTGDGVSISSNNVRLEGAFRFRGAGTDGSGNRANNSQEHRGLFVTGNNFYANNIVCNGNNGSGALLFNAQNFLVENSCFHDNYGLFSLGDDADGIQTGWQSTGLIRFCTMYNNSDDAWDAWNDSTPLNGQIIVEYCAGWSNGRASNGDGNAWKPTNNCIVRYNLAWVNRMRGVENGGGQFTMTNQQFRNNTIFQNGAGGTGGGGMTISGNNHTITQNVIFCNWNWFQNQNHSASFNACNLTDFPGRVIGVSPSDFMSTANPGISGDIFWSDVIAANYLRIASGSPLQTAGPSGSRLGAY